MTEHLLPGLYGGSAAVCLLVAVAFLRYWKNQRDRLFGFFAGAFTAFAIGWAIRTVVEVDEHQAWAFLPRIVGFVLIIIAILDKNRRARASR